MTIPEFIEKAQAGGWHQNVRGLIITSTSDGLLKDSRTRWSEAGRRPSTPMEDLSFSAGYGEGQRHVGIFLDPAAWRAVGEIEGWTEEGAYWNMMGMISSQWLTESLRPSVKEYIAKL